MTEIRADWVPATLATLDQLAAEAGAPLAMKPSEYYRRNCAVAPSSTHRAEVEMRHEIGLEQMIFGMDYPHHEGTWPNTRAWIQAAFAGVPEHEARLILGENAIRFYGLDRDHLARVAARMSPAMSWASIGSPSSWSSTSTSGVASAALPIRSTPTRSRTRSGTTSRAPSPRPAEECSSPRPSIPTRCTHRCRRSTSPPGSSGTASPRTGS
jgi:hypothetical protein